MEGMNRSMVTVRCFWGARKKINAPNFCIKVLRGGEKGLGRRMVLPWTKTDTHWEQNGVGHRDANSRKADSPCGES